MKTLKSNTKRQFGIGHFVRIAGKSYMVDSIWERPEATASHAAHVKNQDELRLSVEYIAQATSMPVVVIYTRTQTLICYAQEPFAVG